jgi:mono/diheme cytochrome c family protein
MRCEKRAIIWLLSMLSCLPAGFLAAQPTPANVPPLVPPGLRPVTPPRPPQPQGRITPGGPSLVFDSEVKQYDATPGEAVAPFVFNLTNVWTSEVIIDRVQASCGCTTASLPPVPWHIPPGGTGQVKAQVRLAGKSGLIAKTLTFFTSVGTRVLTLKVSIPTAPAAGGALGEAQRNAAMAQATNAQAIFTGSCAVCHVEKGRNLLGQDLYAADCGICHESPQRASMVPDLHAPKEATDFDYWRTVITLGKPHTMMPAFAAAHGGPLTDEQVISLAAYLNRTISHHFIPMTTNAPAP